MRWTRIGMMMMWAGIGLAAGVAGQATPAERDVVWTQAPTEGAFPQDPGDELYRQARRALQREQYQEAARLFHELRQRHARSAYVGDSYYFEALAHYREASRASLERARSLLNEQRELFPDAATAEDALTLAARVNAAAARRGDARAAAEVRRQAAQSCDSEAMGVRSAALSALLQMDAARALPILKEILADRGDCAAELRKQAVFMVAQHQTGETVDILVDLAHRNPDPDPGVREAAVFWLSQVDDPRAAAALRGILESDGATPAVQERALFALGQAESPESRTVLEAYARRTDAPVNLRETAIFWLGHMDGGSAFLRELYGTLSDPQLKERALFAVAQSDEPGNQSWLLGRALDTRESLEVRRAALFWAGQSGVAPSEVVRIYKTSQDLELREHALLVLSQAGESDQRAAVDALMEIARTETNPELKERVVFWLGQTDDPRVPEFLLQLIRGG